MKTALLLVLTLMLAGCGQVDCTPLLPAKNPYSTDSSAHWAGWQAAQSSAATSCTKGNDPAFAEGCNVYVAQKKAYDKCVSNQ